MKKLVLVLAIVFAGVMSANAQVWVGGGLGANIHSGYTQLSIAPEVGYMFADTPFTLALGADYTYTDNGVLGTTNDLYLEPYLRYVGGTIGKKFSLFVDLCGDFGLLDAGGYGIFLRPGIAWQATDKFTAAFRFGFAGYDHGFYGTNGFRMNCDLAAPQIRIYYNL